MATETIITQQNGFTYIQRKTLGKMTGVSDKVRGKKPQREWNGNKRTLDVGNGCEAKSLKLAIQKVCTKTLITNGVCWPENRVNHPPDLSLAFVENHWLVERNIYNFPPAIVKDTISKKTYWRKRFTLKKTISIFFYCFENLKLPVMWLK